MNKLDACLRDCAGATPPTGWVESAPMEMQHSTITLQPGIYILRHPQGGAPMSVGRAIGAAECEGRIEAMFTPGTHGTLLRSSADCIILQVFDAPVALLISSYLEKAGDKAPSLKVDKVALDVAQSLASKAAVQAPHRERVIEIVPQGITVIGHIERTGDVVAGPATRLGDPANGLRLEGFQVMWPDKPTGVDIVYAISVEGHGKTEAVRTGNFAGTRGQGRRITELVFSLEGANAGQYALAGEVCFSGGFKVPIEAGAALSGPSGLEHLASLMLLVNPAPQKAKKTPNPWENPSKTKVLKSKKPTPKKNS